MANFPIWDSTEQNIVEPTQTLFDNGFPQDEIPTSGNMNYLFLTSISVIF